MKNDADGQVLIRDEYDLAPSGAPHEWHYYFNGLKLGDISNNGTSNVDYAQSIAAKTALAGNGAFRGGATTGTPSGDFDQSYDPINGLNYASAPSRYVVEAGDTLQSVAQALWGDSSFWYLIAEANGLEAGANLAAGRSLIIPNKVHNVHNSASTWRVYDPNEAVGNNSPKGGARSCVWPTPEQQLRTPFTGKRPFTGWQQDRPLAPTSRSSAALQLNPESGRLFISL